MKTVPVLIGQIVEEGDSEAEEVVPRDLGCLSEVSFSAVIC